MLANEVAWLTKLLDELQINYDKPTLFIDNKSTIETIKSNKYSRGTKHIDLRYHYIQKEFRTGKFEIHHVAGSIQPADILTKALNGPKLIKMRELLGLTPKKAKALIISLVLLASGFDAAKPPFSRAPEVIWTETNVSIHVENVDFTVSLEITDSCSQLNRLQKSVWNSTMSDPHSIVTRVFDRVKTLS